MRKFEKENEQAGGGCCYGVTGGTDFSGTAKAAFGMLGALFLSGVSENALAQCVATTDCATLGYTESSCPDGGVKCPFGDKWACLSGSSGGVPSAKCEIGWILYSDKSCSSTENYDIRKTPIGVVVYTYPDGGGIAMALETVSGKGFETQKCFECLDCGPIYDGPYCDTEVLSLSECLALYSKDFSQMRTSSAEDAAQDFDSCGNTKILAENGYNISGVTQYATEGTSAGDWCLPAAGVMKMIVDNYGIWNETFNLLGKSLLNTSYDTYTTLLSSTPSSGMAETTNFYHCPPGYDFATWSGVAYTGSSYQPVFSFGFRLANSVDSMSGSGVDVNPQLLPVLEF